MIDYTNLMIDAFRWTSAPARAINAWRLKSTGKLPLFVLFYHRVADSYQNPWTISRARFAEQINWLAANFQVVSLEKCQSIIDSGKNHCPTVAITFDDGYAENSEFALPYLFERKIPFAYFVTLQNVLEQKPFQHDLARSQPLAVDSIDTIRALGEIGVEIGGHTRTHCDCGKLRDPEQLRDEIIESANELEDLIGKSVRYFAFPYGQHANLTPASFEICRQAGFRGVCSAYGGANEIGGDAFHLQRIHGDPSFARLRNWLSYGGRQMNVAKFDYKRAVGEEV